MTPQELERNKNREQQKESLPKTSESEKGRAVFGDGKSETTTSLEKISDSVRTELETLRGLQILNPTPDREQQIHNLERKRKRSMSFALLQTK